MRYVKIAFKLLLLSVIVAFVDYTLPAFDVVRIVGTEVVRTDVGSNSFFWSGGDSGTGSQPNRDIRFINSLFPDEQIRVYRNEDTGWGWPPYLKFDSGNLQAEAQNHVGSEKGWVAVRHYGWRIPQFSIFPNALSIRPVFSPGETIINWVRIVGIVLACFLLLVVWRLWRMFRVWLDGKWHSVMSKFR